MRYRELFKLGWSLTWREMAWCTVVGIPGVLVLGLLFNALGLQKATNPTVFMAAFVVTAIIVVLFLAMPRVLRAVISARYPSFHVAVRRNTIPADAHTLRYTEALQLAFFVVLAMLAAETAIALTVPEQRIGAVGSIAVSLLIVNPAIAAIMLKIPYRGFRLEIVREV